jgi:prephenate dehydrogenase
MFNTVTIIGVGEIGGSLGKDIKKRRLAKTVIGIGRRRSSLRKAKRVGAVDGTYRVNSMKRGVKDADLIILATPVGTIVELGRLAAAYAKKGAIITDVGSTKKSIVEGLEKALPGHVCFVGAHPMAGSEKGGPESATADLFKGRDCFLTKTKRTDPAALKEVQRFWKRLGARTILVSLKEHDRIVAHISQMVHLVASGLVIAAGDALPYAASGFRDTTRIALSDPGLWKDICATNDTCITEALDRLIAVLKSFRNAISKKQSSRIGSMLAKARGLRRELCRHC